MKLGDRRGLQRGHQQIHCGERRPGPPGRPGPGLCDLAPRQEVDRPGAQRQRRRLQHEQRPDIIPEPKERGDGQKDRLDVVGQADADLLVLDLLEGPAVRRVPDRQIDLAQVGLVRQVSIVQADGVRRKPHREEEHQEDDNGRRPADGGHDAAPRGVPIGRLGVTHGAASPSPSRAGTEAPPVPPRRGDPSVVAPLCGRPALCGRPPLWSPPSRPRSCAKPTASRPSR